MFQSKPCPFEEDVAKATNENNLTEDWSLIMLICDNAVNYSEGSKFCLKAILKRLHHNVPRVVIQALTLLDACVKNCDRNFLLQVASMDFTTEVRKLLGKMHPSASLKLKELLQKWSLEEFKDDPELCIIPALYYKLKSEGVEFPPQEKEKKLTPKICTDPDAVTSQEEENDIIKAIEISLKDTGKYAVPVNQDTPDSSIGAKSASEPFKVRAIYDFDAAEDNELTIKIGEIVLVSDNSNSSWWKGSNHRGEGLFPANFVTEDLDAEPELPKVETSSETQIISETSEEIIEINEKKIDECLNWLSDVDPTEEPSDPEEMLKLEKECYKMGPLIEGHLQTIDNRLAKLSLVNEKIMAAFDLFHDLSVQYPTFPATMKFLPSAIQMTYASPQPIVVQSNANLHDSVAQETVLSPPDAIHTLSKQEGNKAADTSQTSTNSYASQNLNSDGNSSTNISSNSSTNVSGPADNQPTHPAVVMNPYGGNMMGNFFVPPGMPIPFPANTQPAPGAYFPISGNVQNFMPIPGQPLGPYIPYYYMNPTLMSTQQQQTVDTAPSNSQTQSVTLNTSTSVSNVLSSTPLPSVSSYYSDLQQISTSDTSTDNTLKQETVQNLTVQASGDGQISTSGSSSENL